MAGRNGNGADAVGRDPRQVAEAFAGIGRRLAAQADAASALKALCDTAVEIVPGARWVSVSRGRDDRFTTMAFSDHVARDADMLQYRLGTGPCIDAVIGESVFESADLALDSRWMSFGPQASRDLGTRSVLSVRLAMDGPEDLNAGLNLYSDRIHGFDATARHVAVLLAAHAATAVAAVLNREAAQHLHEALDSNREIGVAMGVLMATLHVTRQEAFDLLRVASQNSNRKLRDIATEVADTGVLDVGPSGRRQP